MDDSKSNQFKKTDKPFENLAWFKLSSADVSTRVVLKVLLTTNWICLYSRLTIARTWILFKAFQLYWFLFCGVMYCLHVTRFLFSSTVSIHNPKICLRWIYLAWQHANWFFLPWQYTLCLIHILDAVLCKESAEMPLKKTSFLNATRHLYFFFSLSISLLKYNTSFWRSSQVPKYFHRIIYLHSSHFRTFVATITCHEILRGARFCLRSVRFADYFKTRVYTNVIFTI